jgi:small subunit ribosomal protein S20
MPNTKSGKKRMKQSQNRRTFNRSVKSSIKTQVRKLRDAVTSHVDKADEELKTLAKRVDKAAAHGVIHGNTAARLKSRLNAVVKKAKVKAKA